MRVESLKLTLFSFSFDLGAVKFYAGRLSPRCVGRPLSAFEVCFRIHTESKMGDGYSHVNIYISKHSNLNVFFYKVIPVKQAWHKHPVDCEISHVRG